MLNKQAEMVKIYLNNDCIIIQYNSNGRLNMHSITPQFIIEYCKNNNKQDIADSIIKKEVNKYGLKYIYKFNKAVVIVGEDTNHKSEFTREFKVDILFHMTNNFSTIFEHNVTLNHCNFSKDVIFTRCIFRGDLSIFDCDFRQKVNFGGSIFNGRFACAGSNFSNKVDFHNTQFENIPIFISSCFENPQMADFVRVKIKNNIESLQVPQWQKTNILEVRDSYRAIKNILIAQNNLLDASHWHKLELYTKEIELKDEKPKPFSKEWIDLWQLKFYRLTSNHHTDLLRIFSCIVILIGCFATTLFFAEYCSNPKIWYGIFLATFGVVSIFTTFGKIRYLGFFTLLSLVPCTWLVSYNPKYIFGVASLFGDNNCNGVFLNFAFSIYTILFILLIFSLQKTARRNSIIPT